MASAIRYVVALQEAAGLDVVTDGEWRRKSYIGVIAELVDAAGGGASDIADTAQALGVETGVVEVDTSAAEEAARFQLLNQRSKEEAARTSTLAKATGPAATESNSTKDLSDVAREASRQGDENTEALVAPPGAGRITRGAEWWAHPVSSAVSVMEQPRTIPFRCERTGDLRSIGAMHGAVEIWLVVASLQRVGRPWQTQHHYRDPQSPRCRPESRFHRGIPHFPSHLWSSSRASPFRVKKPRAPSDPRRQ